MTSAARPHEWEYRMTVTNAPPDHEPSQDRTVLLTSSTSSWELVGITDDKHHVGSRWHWRRRLEPTERGALPSGRSALDALLGWRLSLMDNWPPLPPPPRSLVYALSVEGMQDVHVPSEHVHALTAFRHLTQLERLRAVEAWARQ